MMENTLAELLIIIAVEIVKLLLSVFVVAIGCGMGWLVGKTFGLYLSGGIEQAFGLYIPPATYPAIAGFLSFFRLTQFTASFHSPSDN